MSRSVKRYAVVLGARPNFIKAAALFHAAKNDSRVSFTLIHTGQHFDEKMSDIFFRELQLPKPDIHLNVTGQFHTEKIGKMFNELKRIFAQQRYDAVILFGDVNSSLAGGIAAAKDGQRIIHIEAGLRSHDRRMPEEINRAVVDHLADELFTTEPSANENLRREGIEGEHVHYVGNIMIETLEVFRDGIEKSGILSELGLEPRRYAVATLHRQENTDDPAILERLLDLLHAINQEIPIVLPLHPGTVSKVKGAGLGAKLDSIRVIEPLGYYEFIKLVMESTGVVTDSGGIQEETSHLGIPCATLRDNTERPITCEIGSNKLFPVAQTDVKKIIEHLRRTDFKKGNIPLWDAGVSKRILDALD